MNKQTNCAYPFNSLFVDSVLDVKFCCAGNGILGNLKDSTTGELLNSQLAQDIRAGQFTDEGHPYCKSCVNLIQQGVGSQRLEIIKNDPTVIKDKFTLARVDIRWSNTCNLSCNYCMPYFSSKWASIMEITTFHPVSAAIEKQLFEFIEENASTVGSIMLLGGEPFLQKQNARLIELLPGRGVCLLTNLSIPILENNISKQLLNEEYVEWGVSFETVGDRFEYVRHGATWAAVEHNMQILKARDKHITLFPLYCIYSAFNLVELYDTVIGKGYVDYIQWQLLVTEELDVFNLSRELRQLAIAEIDRVTAKYPTASGIETLQGLRKTLENSMVRNKNINADTLRWTNTLESKYMVKTKSFAELWPELHDMLQLV
jgi:hypothetical protein